MRAIMVLVLVVLIGCGSGDEVAMETEKVMQVAPYFLMAESWDCDSFFDRVSTATDLRVAILWNTPGKNTTCLNRLLEDPRLNFLEIHLVNDACVRNGNCGSYELFYGLTTEKEQRLFEQSEGWFMNNFQDYLIDARDYLLPRLGDQTACTVNGLLEANITDQAAENMLAILKATFGSRCKTVWNPVDPGNLHDYGQDVSELHGLNAGNFLSVPCIASNDGSNSMGMDLVVYESKSTQCQEVFRWYPSDNCRVFNAPFIDPRERACR